ncbi:MAG TPA: DMT family transporter [Oligoflexus sp.]|uniref:DMT family transporter n=1 Tax=Oligoflexus sp. TaxID=1971216 RepID=UPI002D293DC8|nr:DMT family transporter [Oligoflexus sp.]HYX35220.1 DMT family transporter [Oligoflexus sp.]
MLGNLLAISCAMVWSLSIILMKKSGARIHPLALNLGKNVIGLVLLLLTAWIVDGGVQVPPARETSLLLLSGFLGIGVADGLVLRAMQHLHASHVGILECLFAPFVIILSVLFLGEKPTLTMFVGGAFIVASLLFVKPTPSSDDPKDPPGKSRGVLLMAMGLFLIALGIILVKPLFDSTSLISLVTIRMTAGVVGSALIFAMVGDRRARFREFFTAPHKAILLSGCVLSAYLSIILWVAGYKYLQASVAALLNQTSTIFTLIFAIIFLQEKLTRSKVIAICLAMSGAALITLAS